MVSNKSILKRDVAFVFFITAALLDPSQAKSEMQAYIQAEKELLKATASESNSDGEVNLINQV